MDDTRAAGFGDRDLDAVSDAVILAIGRTVVDGLGTGMSGEDAASVYFHHPSQPTLRQVKTLINGAVEKLAPSWRSCSAKVASITPRRPASRTY